MIEIGIALKTRADVEVAYELSNYAGSIRAVDYSPLLRYCIDTDSRAAAIATLKAKVVPSERSSDRKQAANYLLRKLGSRPVWRSREDPNPEPYGSHVIQVPLATVSAFEVGEMVKAGTPHSDIVREDVRWLLRFPVDVVRFVVDAIESYINQAESPVAVRSAEDLLTAIELRLVRLSA